MPILIFFGTYIVGNSVFYLIFGNSYLETPAENQTLVFLTTWFSFAEKVPVQNTPLLQALRESVFDWNFGVPAIILTASSSAQYWKPQWLELRIKEYRFPHFNPGWVYGLSILSSYAVSFLRWQYGHLKPSTGISIIAVCLLATYPIASLALFLREFKGRSLENTILALIGFVVIISGAVYVLSGYEGNGLHVAGLILYFLFALALAGVALFRRSPQTSTSQGKE